jgi:hypothetical protein
VWTWGFGCLMVLVGAGTSFCRGRRRSRLVAASRRCRLWLFTGERSLPLSRTPPYVPTCARALVAQLCKSALPARAPPPLCSPRPAKSAFGLCSLSPLLLLLPPTAKHKTPCRTARTWTGARWNTRLSAARAPWTASWTRTSAFFVLSSKPWRGVSPLSFALFRHARPRTKRPPANLFRPRASVADLHLPSRRPELPGRRGLPAHTPANHRRPTTEPPTPTTPTLTTPLPLPKPRNATEPGPPRRSRTTRSSSSACCTSRTRTTCGSAAPTRACR